MNIIKMHSPPRRITFPAVNRARAEQPHDSQHKTASTTITTPKSPTHPSNRQCIYPLPLSLPNVPHLTQTPRKLTLPTLSVLALLASMTTSVLGTPASSPVDAANTLEKRCQNRGQYCDRLAIRCCGGSWCTYIATSGTRYCSKYPYDNGPGHRVAGEVEGDDEGDGEGEVEGDA
jgi:hypothetical protein